MTRFGIRSEKGISHLLRKRGDGIYIFLPSGRPEADFLEGQLKLCPLRKDLPARNHLRAKIRKEIRNEK